MDRVSVLPDSILHCILSFLDTKCVAQTSVLSKRWNHIWTSIPTLVFLKRLSKSETDNFMEFVDTTLLLHDASSIQKFHLRTNEYMSASRVHSWVKSLTKRSVEDLQLWLARDIPFNIPVSLFTCESLVKFELTATNTTHLPRSFSFPKLVSLTLSGIRFTDDWNWNDQQFSNCPVLEDLYLGDCSWSDVRNFCISTPALKHLKFYAWEDDGLRDCALKVNAPNLVSLTYVGYVAKEYVLSSFETLEFADVLFLRSDVGIERKIGYGAAIRKFFRAISHVENLRLDAETLEAVFIIDDFAFPTFHNLDDLILGEGKTNDRSLFSLLKAVPNLRLLLFEESCIDDNIGEEHSWASHMLAAGCIFQHLKSVTFHWFSGNARQMRWLKLILNNAKALRTIWIDGIFEKSKEELMSELPCLPRASKRCKFRFED